ncbi:MAG: hypothetical protein B6A08_15475 [Sorangiineae bacterium NIC37A_2]|nr:MAG: hypothetical protein B6A08_15475 [Sorangiineae bacterium NIC37A_2]
MTAFAQALLILTSIAPIGLVYAGVLADGGMWGIAKLLAGTACGLAFICALLLRGAEKVVAPVPLEASDITPKEGDALAFLVAYALPLLALEEPKTAVSWGLIVFTVSVAVTLWQQQLFHVNPVVALMGYKFYSARNDQGALVLIISRRRVLAPGTLSIVKLSDYLWLQDSGVNSS